MDSIKYNEPDATGYVEDEVEEQEEEEQVQVEATDDRIKIIHIMEYYLETFPTQLARFQNINFDSLTIDELREVREKMNFCIGANNTMQTNIKTFQHGLLFLEGILPQYGFNITGISTLCNDKETLDDVKALSLKYLDSMTIEPEYRLLYKVLSTGFLLHNANQSKAMVDNINKKDKFKGL